MARIYTKTGDKGETGLVGGQRVPKTAAVIEAYGTVDELNAVLGLAREACEGEKKLKSLGEDLATVQHWLFDLGGLLAADPADRVKFKLRPMTAQHAQWMEKRMDEATAQLPPLKDFILPGGSEASARMHLARTVCRRAERLCLASELKSWLPDGAGIFLNRLSDYFFVMARLANHRLGVSDVKWQAVEPGAQ
jgi:cob(I)alamin adenosyltransferase